MSTPLRYEIVGLLDGVTVTFGHAGDISEANRTIITALRAGCSYVRQIDHQPELEPVPQRNPVQAVPRED